MRTKVIAIVPAAGRGERFHPSIRKTFVEVAGVPLLIYTLKRLHEIKPITEIIPVLREGDMEKGLELIEAHNLSKIKRIAPGGEERQDSIYNALRLIREVEDSTLRDGLVLIHDGVRPLIFAGLIEKLLHDIKGVDGVALGLPVKETLKEVDARMFVLSTVTREKLWAIQTPQVFPVRVIKKAYDRAYKDGFYATDDAALVERIGGKVKIIAGSPFNIKVTTPEDLEMVEYLLSKQ